MIYGCQCGGFGSVCGNVAEVLEHVTADGMDHWWVREDRHGRRVRVRREPNGCVYEVTLTLGSSV